MNMLNLGGSKKMQPTRESRLTGIVGFLVCCACFSWLADPLLAGPITELIPADSMVVYVAKPYRFLSPSSGPATTAPAEVPFVVSVTAVVGMLNAAGMIPGEGQVYADIVAALPLLGQFEHAMALLDVSAKLVDPADDDDGESGQQPSKILRLNRLQAALIFRTDSESGLVLEQLNRIMGRYTNREVARLSRHEVSGVAYQRLTDERMAAWAVWEWGRVDSYFVVTFGEGAFERIVASARGKSPAMSSDEWYRSAVERTGAADSLAHWFIGFLRLRNRLDDVADHRVRRVVAALQAERMTHDLWSIGTDGRALTLRRCYRSEGQDMLRSYSDPADYAPRHLSIVPKDAKRMAILQVPTRWLVDNVPRAWIASQSETNVRKWQTAWERLEQEKGIDISGSLIDHFGNNVVIFEYPEHPLKIPFALTLAIEINDPRAVRMAIDALLDAWSQYLDERAERNKTVLVRVKVLRDEDHVWYLQAGILGPALKVTDGYVVISWSPTALREALKHIEGTPPTGKRVLR